MAGCDAIAVGGGLAGAAFALELARRGGHVVIVERTSAARHKVCGDFLSSEAQQILAYLGIDVGAMGARPNKRLRLVSGKHSAVAPLPFTGVSISRKAIDEALLDAAQRAGATVIRGEAASALTAETGKVSVRAGRQILQAKAAVLATGKHNLRGHARSSAGATAFKMIFEPTSAAAQNLNEVVQLVSYAGGYAGSCRLEDGSVSVCWLASPALLGAERHDWRTQLDWISRQSPHFGDLVAGAMPLLQQPLAVSAIPYGYHRETAIAPNVYAVGDQLAVIHSFTGDGTSIALMSGVTAAQALVSGRTAGEFQARLVARVRRQMRLARMVEIASRPRLARWLGIRAINLAPWIATHVAALTRIGDPGFDLPLPATDPAP